MLHHALETGVSHPPKKIADFSLRWTFICILLLHFIAIFWMIRSPFKTLAMKKTSSKIQIKTVHTPVKPIAAIAPTAAATPKAPPKEIPKKEIPKETPKKEAPKEVAKKETPKAALPKPEPVKKNPPQSSTAKQPEKSEQKTDAKETAQAQKKGALIAEAKEKLAKLGEVKEVTPLPKSPPLPEMSLPGRLENLQIDTLSELSMALGPSRTQEISYRDEVANRLKQQLRLPEYGTVQVRLTLERSGQVAHLQITSSKSAKNSAYIEKTLPSISFPPLSSYFPDTDRYTFLITLSNI